MRNRSRTYALRCVAVLACGVLAACASAADTADDKPSPTPSASPTSEPTPSPSEPSEEPEEEPTVDKSITIASTPWEETVAVSHLWQHVLRENGYDVEIKELSDLAIAYPAMASGEADVFFGAWMPSQKTYLRDNEASVEDMGPWFKRAATTIVVPKYVNAKTIGDLSKLRKRLGGAITGPEQQSPLSQTVKNKVLPKYGLKGLSLRATSTAAVLQELETATESHKPIAATLWHPHWAYEELPIKDLSDPKGALKKPDSIHTVVRTGLRTENRALGKALDGFTMSAADLESLMAAIHQDANNNPAKTVKRWASNNKQVVKKMLD